MSGVENQLQQYFDALQRLGIAAQPAATAPGRVTKGYRPDLVLEIQGPRGKSTWAAELKVHIEPGALGPIINRLKALQVVQPRTLLLTEYATPHTASALRKAGINFIDAAGNASINDDWLRIEVEGHKPPPERSRKRKGLYAAGLRILYVLLKHGPTQLAYRDIAAQAHVALGSVGTTLTELAHRGWIERTSAQGFRLRDADAMLKRWSEGYADTLRPKLLLTNCRMMPDNQLPQLLHIAQQHGPRVLVGGELAAAALTNTGRPITAALHVREADAQDIMKELRLYPDRQGPIALLRRLGNNDMMTNTTTPHNLIDPLLIYAELLVRPDDRLREVADSIYIRQIQPRWK